MFTPSNRRPRGQSMVALVLVIAFFVIGTVGMLGFELNRMSLARDQLRAACDAAALAAAAALASSDNVDPMEAHTLAVSMALSTFQQNSVLGVPLEDVSLVYDDDDDPDSNHGSMFVQFLDPHNSNQAVEMGDPSGKIVRIVAAFGAEPAFGRYVGVGKMPVRVQSSGGVPNLDVVLCFDVSGSIDDQSPVTFIKRVWNHTTARIDYTQTATTSGSPAGASARGRIYDVIGPPPTGTRVNGIYPQYLSLSSAGDVDYPVFFSERPSGTGSAPGLRGTPNTGSPPGNRASPGMSLGNSRTFTDMVVNIDGNNTFGGFTTADGYDFTEIGLVVEAARGNLDTVTAFQNSRCNARWPSFTPRSGYQAKYFELARQNLHPIHDAQQAGEDFFTIMNTNTDGHFSFIAFSDNAGSNANTTYNESNVDDVYPSAGTSNFPIPLIPLDHDVGDTQYDAIQAKIPTLVATTSTNIGDAVDKAVTQLSTNNRPGAKKAIVLFTDGMPTSGGPLDNDPWTNARRAAVRARDRGIPIYTIGLAQNPEIVPQETAILNDTNANVNSGGMAAIAGNGGKFFLVTDVTNLRYTFENIARHLVQLVK